MAQEWSAKDLDNAIRQRKGLRRPLSTKAIGTKRTCHLHQSMSAFGGIADIGVCLLYPQKRTLELSRAMSALCHKQTHALQQKRGYSITSSAMASTPDGIVRPSVLAILRLIINSGQAAVAPPRSVMNSRRSMGFPRAEGHAGGTEE